MKELLQKISLVLFFFALFIVLYKILFSPISNLLFGRVPDSLQVGFAFLFILFIMIISIITTQWLGKARYREVNKYLIVGCTILASVAI